MSIFSGENVSTTATALRSKEIRNKQFYHYLPDQFKILHKFSIISIVRKNTFMEFIRKTKSLLIRNIIKNYKYQVFLNMN